MSAAVESFWFKAPALLLVSGAANAISILAVTTVLLLTAVVIYLKVADTSSTSDPKQRIPGPLVNPMTTLVIPLINIFRNHTISASALYFQIICGYSHVFDKQRLYKIAAGPIPIVILFKPDTVEKVLSSHTLIDKSFPYTLIAPWLKGGLLNSTGSKWRHRRKLLTPTFHFRILDEFLPVFEEQSRILIEKLDSLMKGREWIDVGPVVSLCTLDIICETAMGKNLGAQKNSRSLYVESLHKLCMAFANRLISPWLWPDAIYFRTSYGQEFRKNLNAMDSFTRQVIKERKEEMLRAHPAAREQREKKDAEQEEEIQIFKRRKALLDLMLSIHIDENSLTLDDIAEEVDNFMFAGHDTTASGINWTLYEIGLLPDIQAKLHEEIDCVFGDDLERPVTLDDLRKMVYLDWVLKEARRLHPPTPIIARQLCEDTVINGYTVPKGTICAILVYMLHRNTEVFHNPEVFNPERFRPDNVSGRHPFAYVPFSAGPRNCIGQRFALLEAKVVIANLLRHFTMKSMDQRDRVQVTPEVVLRSESPLRIQFTKRGGWKNAIFCKDIEEKEDVFIA